jgi:hypothetical protein
MAYLYWKQDGEVTLIARQTRAGNLRDIPDLIGIDGDNNVVICFARDDDDAVLINPRTPDPLDRTRIAKPMGSYDEAWYRQNHEDGAVDLFMLAVRWLEAQASERGWDLQTKFNKNHVTLKYGGLNAMGVDWSGIKTWWFFFRVSEEQAQPLLDIPGVETSWNKSWELLYCRVSGPDNFAKLLPCVEAAYSRYAG